MRSKYIGVYNNSKKHGTEAYRVALKGFINGEPNYTDLGKFNDEVTAAWVFNIHAINRYGGAAVINDVSIDDIDLDEYQGYTEAHPNFHEKELKALKIIESTTCSLRTHKDFHD